MVKSFATITFSFIKWPKLLSYLYGAPMPTHNLGYGIPMAKFSWLQHGGIDCSSLAKNVWIWSNIPFQMETY